MQTEHCEIAVWQIDLSFSVDVLIHACNWNAKIVLYIGDRKPSYFNIYLQFIVYFTYIK